MRPDWINEEAWDAALDELRFWDKRFDGPETILAAVVEALEPMICERVLQACATEAESGER